MYLVVTTLLRTYHKTLRTFAIRAFRYRVGITMMVTLSSDHARLYTTRLIHFYIYLKPNAIALLRCLRLYTIPPSTASIPPSDPTTIVSIAHPNPTPTSGEGDKRFPPPHTVNSQILCRTTVHDCLCCDLPVSSVVRLPYAPSTTLGGIHKQDSVPTYHFPRPPSPPQFHHCF